MIEQFRVLKISILNHGGRHEQAVVSVDILLVFFSFSFQNVRQ